MIIFDFIFSLSSISMSSTPFFNKSYEWTHTLFFCRFRAMLYPNIFALEIAFNVVLLRLRYISSALNINLTKSFETQIETTFLFDEWD